MQVMRNSFAYHLAKTYRSTAQFRKVIAKGGRSYNFYGSQCSYSCHCVA